MNQYNHINGSPIITSYFIPNTPTINPQTYNDNHNTNKQSMIIEEEQEQIQEPGSTKPVQRRKRRRRSSGISSQPEGIYSPVPKSKILDELNQSINGLIINDDGKSEEDQEENEEQQQHNFHIPSEFMHRKRQSFDDIRDFARREFEKMDKAIDADLSLLNPMTPMAPLSTQMSRLQIADSNKNRNYHRTPIEKMDIDQYGNIHAMNEDKQNIYIEKEPINIKLMLFNTIKQIFNKDIWIWIGVNIINFALIIVLLLIYANIVDFQWK